MKRWARGVEIAIGAFFVFAAAVKLLDIEGFQVQIAAYRVISGAGLIKTVSVIAIAVEALLGIWLLMRPGACAMVYIAGAGMTAVYTGLIAYAWPEDCGCLGAAIPMGPVESIAKNVVIIALMGAAYWGTRSTEPLKPTLLSRGLGGMALAALVLTGIVGAVTRPDATTLDVAVEDVEADRPLAVFRFERGGTTYDLGEGEYLVVMLNADCSHCRASVPGLNALNDADDLPPVVALMMGNDDSLDDFMLTTEPNFPMQLIDSFQFLDFIGNAPPRLIYDRDGQQVHFWDWEDETPDAETVGGVVRAQSGSE